MLTVKELKELIKDIPDDVIVLTEGCDCTGISGGISGIFEHNIWKGNGKFETVKAIEIEREK